MKEEWKVFIRGVDGRGDEVIKMLEDRGGCNHCRFDGEDPDSIYFISHEGSIRCKFSECEFGKVIMDNYHELRLPEQWKPKNGETYWVVYGNGRITSLKWEDFSIGNDYLDFGNCFKTKEEAFIMSKKIRDLLKEK